MYLNNNLIILPLEGCRLVSKEVSQLLLESQMNRCILHFYTFFERNSLEIFISQQPFLG